VLQEFGFPEQRSRCDDLRWELRLGLPGRMQIVGDGTGTDETFVLSCCPGRDSSWRLSGDDIDAKLAEKKLPGALLRLDPRNPWVRIALPYYMNVRDLNRLCDFLGEATGGAVGH
jgi:hypothetical protein